jgi:enoyl-CoA hydratase
MPSLWTTPGRRVQYELPDELTVTATGSVRVVTMNRPAVKNAVNEGLHYALGRIWPMLADDEDARVVILTGAGESFCAGGDFHFIEQSATDEAHRNRTMRDARKIVAGMLACPLPVIAAVNGPAVGLGCSLALMSDIVLMADTAFLADPHVPLGVVAADGGAVVWPFLSSLLKAKEYLFTGDRISAQTAVELGLANRVVPGSALARETRALAERLADRPKQALQSTKRVLNLQSAAAGIVDFALSAEAETLAAAEFLERLTATRPRPAGRR